MFNIGKTYVEAGLELHLLAKTMESIGRHLDMRQTVTNNIIGRDVEEDSSSACSQLCTCTINPAHSIKNLIGLVV